MLTDNATKIILTLIGLLGVGVAIKLFVDKSHNKVRQTGNKVGGDQAGRDIHK